jgi:hypothetical protein
MTSEYTYSGRAQRVLREIEGTEYPDDRPYVERALLAFARHAPPGLSKSSFIEQIYPLLMLLPDKRCVKLTAELIQIMGWPERGE